MRLFKRVPFYKMLKAAIEAAEEHGYEVIKVEQDHKSHPVVMDENGEQLNVTGAALKRKISKEELLEIAKKIDKVHTPILDDTPGEGKFSIHLEKQAGSKKKTQHVWIEVKGTLGFRLFDKVYGHEPTIGPWGIGATNSSHQAKITKAYKKKLEKLKG